MINDFIDPAKTKGRNRNSVDQLEPYKQHAPKQRMGQPRKTFTQRLSVNSATRTLRPCTSRYSNNHNKEHLSILSLSWTMLYERQRFLLLSTSPSVFKPSILNVKYKKLLFRPLMYKLYTEVFRNRKNIS
ncbi:uncharacterized protein NEPG_00326 [Nematocida parisii ERTm1]|uniref:uncharacterized protein n=1 Tax=Nematocida parisii (strain ERTm1 / ATCC PRA-289) TaxID=881290 RepID=UPI000264B46B|nr:uncharacterized protein NEPG_00326 [Nematocida parisii ERTm1]EIJ94802.1 hypothetical protein NEPG_00326 [Nematocida parisii ERTm1]KAI5157968.1 hypothetical protein NEPAR05_1750 [Nematocida parisii]|eukprot:XP_013058158.1 hypothetical protein NEPG_00326 [Nematocida parisii ERTm1]